MKSFYKVSITAVTYNRLTHLLSGNSIYSTGHYINVVTYSSGTHLFVMDIKNAEIILQNTNIIRIHRSYMINMACIKDINYTDITLSADIIEIRHLPIGRSYRQKVKSLYTKYLLN